MTDGRRQTGRQAFVLRVIGSSTARIRERLADGDVIVVEVIRGPLFARGLLGVFSRASQKLSSSLGNGATDFVLVLFFQSS